MSNSPLVVYTKLSPNHSGKRTKKIDTITIHCMAGNCSVETCGNLFASSARQASSNYGIGTDGRIALYVDEANRSWCTSSNANDQRAVTIEVANNGGAPDWPVSAKAYAALLDLVTDICKRNGIKRLVWSTSKNDRVNHLNGCNMTVHRDYANKSCPGDYLYNRHGQIAAEVNKRLGVKDAGGSTGGQTSGSTETGLKVGDVVLSSKTADIKPGNCLPFENIPVGTIIHNIELYPGRGAQLVRSAGNMAQLMAKENGYALVRLPSGEMRNVPVNCTAVIGQVSNIDHENVNLGKAGRKRHMGVRPGSRGTVMNPCDHPHGGGEGRAPVGHSGPMTPWGKPALGLKTRKHHKRSDKLIVKRAGK